MRSCRRSTSVPLLATLSFFVLALAGGAARGQEGVPVSVAPVEERAIMRQVALNGTVTAERSARLSAATSGLVEDLRVDAGSQVEAGDVLLQLDADLARLTVQGAEARLQQAEIALADARRRLQEARELAPKQSIAETVVRDLESEVTLDESALQQARAELGFERAVLERHTLKAPFTGVVSAKLTDLGEWVTPGQGVLELVATDVLRLDFAVAEDFLDSVGEGSEVRYSLNASPEDTYLGDVATVVPVSDPGDRTFLLRVDPGEARPALRPGMSVRAVLHMATGREGIVVPRDATLRYPDGRIVVWTVVDEGEGPRVQENLVQTGLQFDGLVEIRSGLTPDAQVVLRGNEALQGGQRVIVRERLSGARSELD